MSVTRADLNELFEKHESDTNGLLNFLRTVILSQQVQIEKMQKEIEEMKISLTKK
jgi:hypothetical protein